MPARTGSDVDDRASRGIELGSDAEASVPVWVVNLTAEMTAIRTRVEVLPKMVTDLENLRANSVPVAEHLKLLADVDVLKERDLGARSDWEEMRVQVPMLWEERIKQQGARRTYRVWLGVLSVVVTVLTAFTLLHGLGIQVTYKP
jgi:hypothetical protein